MARAAQQQASQNVKMAQGDSAAAGKAAGQIGGILTPQLTQQMQNPQGFGDPTVNQMKTQATEGAGGGEAAAVGQLGLQAARTRNNAGFIQGIDQAARDATANSIQANTGIDIANQQEKLKQQQQAESELGGLYGTNLGAQTGNLNAANSGVNAEVNAGNSGWLQNTLGVMNTLESPFKISGKV